MCCCACGFQNSSICVHTYGASVSVIFSVQRLIVYWLAPMIEQDLHALSKKELTTVRIV